MFGNPFFPEGHHGMGPPRPFRTQYRCYSVSMMPGNERESLEQGGKIILPPSALDQLTRLNIVYPMLFKLTNASSSRTTHCGVLEFVADEGKVYVPYWMMQNLALDEGGLLQVESASLPVGNFAKFQPHSVDFLDLTNPKAVLESRLRNFACLSTGDVIAIMYNAKTYEVSVLETKPAAAISVIECDLNVDFAPPVGYQEGQYGGKSGGGGKGTGGDARDARGADDDAEEMDVAALMPEEKGFVAFSGGGMRLDGKKRNPTRSESDSDAAVAAAAQARRAAQYVRGIPDYDYEVGTIRFIRSRPPKAAAADGADNGEKNGFEAFKGEGQMLKGPKRK